MKKQFINLLWIGLVGLLGAGILTLISGPPRGAEIKLFPTTTPSPIIVHVAGAVAAPGRYTLQPGSGVNDAVLAAGGANPDADLTQINLAAVLVDGIQIKVPALTADQSPSRSADTLQIQNPEPPSPLTASDGKININTADKELLDTLPGIGPTLASRIIEFRQANGPYENMEDLLLVSGIGPATLEEIQPLVSVND